MSALKGKHILVIGEENQHIKELEAALQTQGMSITVATCGSVDETLLTAEHIDIVLLNHLHEGDACVELLHRLRASRKLNVLPIFALVENTEEKIQKALILGAADYITNSEPLLSVVNKMKIIFGEADNYSDCINIDITPEVAAVSTSGIKVFFIEDDALLRNLLILQLEKSGFDYKYSTDGADAVTEMIAFAPQVVILDVLLPGKTGFEVLEEMRATTELANVPVIIFSNRDEQADIEKAHSLGVKKYYVKAMTDLSLLVKTIEELAR
jgi:DNA-binding response OmpR family regulator